MAAGVTVIGFAVAAMNCALDIVGTASERSAPDADADAKVEQAQHHHGNNEENEGRYFVERPLGRSILVEHSAKRRFRYQVTSSRIFDVGVDDPCVHSER